MLDNYHKWDQVSKFHKTPIFPGCSLCVHLRDDPWLRKRGCSINWNPFLTNPFVFQKFHDLIHCMLDNGALEQYPQVSRIHEIHTPPNNRMDRAKARIVTLWQMCKLWMTSRGTGEMPMSVKEVWNKVLDTGGCSGESTVERRPIPVAMTGTHANMNDSYNRWNDYKKWITKEIKMNWIKNNV